jgi:hypothetical protein
LGELTGRFFWRFAKLEEIMLVRTSNELWGQPMRNTFCSDTPKVKAFTGRLPAHQLGFEFQTIVPPDQNIPPGVAYWSGPRLGVVVEEKWAKIRVIVTRQRA